MIKWPRIVDDILETKREAEEQHESTQRFLASTEKFVEKTRLRKKEDQETLDDMEALNDMAKNHG